MRGVQRIGLVLLALGALAVTGAECAWAHGGGFRTGDPASPGKPTISSPNTPPIPVVTPGGRSGDRNPATGNRAYFLQEGWQTWWLLNAPELIPARRRGPGSTATNQTGLFDLGARQGDNIPEWEMQRRVVIEKRVLPHLLEIAQAGSQERPTVLAAALVALGRVARHPVPLRTFEHHALDPDATIEVRESAVLAIGLLRRTASHEQIPAADLARARQFLLQLFDDKDAPTRVRAFSAYAIGLLADQPYPRDAIHRDGRFMTRELWRRIDRKYASADLRIALLTALGLQPRAGVPSGVRDGLREIVSGRRVFGREWDGFERSHALTALARVDRTSCLPLLVRVLGSSRQHVSVRTASVLALGEWAPRLSRKDRRWIAEVLRDSWRKEPNWQAQGLYLIALGRLVRAEMSEGQDAMIDGPRTIGGFLTRISTEGSTMVRPFAALGLALSVRELEPRTRPAAAFIRRVHRALERGLQKMNGSPVQNTAYVIGLGLSGARSARQQLFDIMDNKKYGGYMRSEACVALAMLGAGDARTKRRLRELLGERRSSLVFLGAIRAISILGREGTVDTLIKQLRTTRSIGGQTAIAAGLGRLGDLRAVDALIEIAGDKERSVYARAMSLVGLGLVCDPEPKPSRRRLTAGANYPARTASLQQIFNIL